MTQLSALERALERGYRRTPTCALAVSPYRAGSWKAQRLLHRSTSRFRVLVSGRGVGKTHGCAYELLQVVMAAPPGSMGAVLAPTLQHAEAAVEKLREIAAALPGVTAESYVSTKRKLHLPGGRSIKVFSADRKEVVRGPSIVALWIDEAAYLSAKALEASMPAIRQPGTAVQLLISTTPAGKNWVWDWWDGKGLPIERFRFRGTESPYNDQAIIALYRQTVSPEKFAQEYLAEFVDNLLLVFPDREGLFVDSLPARDKARCWMGVDLGKKDYTACALMNEWGEGSLNARWNEDTHGFSSTTYWAQTHEHVARLAKEAGAIAVVDTGGAGGAPGAVLAEHLRSEGIEVVEVKTSSQGTKAQIVEQAQVDVQWGKIKLLRNEHAAQLDYEMSRFQGIKRVVHGRELMLYEGPQVPGENDDCVIAFCLANFGRARAEVVEDPGDGGIAAFVPASAVSRAPAAPSPFNRGLGGSRGGYIFR